ncbi:methyltetrahydrofolate:corrinoid/iron-sulfur protein methyltransferase [[Clostridium] cellulosi]|uniref:Methyltetrahydrofolate:corrinoid/iron-sulfur protein methyltransferase n=1 Tax=[Clostridium] cellulosi TaxID=29343 RepID=A0A078KMD8_9FIRM|nr:MAG: methyltetrahydrofolate--corrinoid methyltransferase [[Clostridium] cellulosi]CDZ23633.1 methyltetrahydrofolate:corrinoid/iron-sulfur protein methyltransferase [[Clostridium] cellulosi]
MIIIGEKINSSIPSAKTAIENKDKARIIELAKAQHDAGAAYIDINAGMFLKEEPEYLAFLAQTVGKELGLPISVDTPSVEAARAALKAAGVRGGLINSVTTEQARLEGMTELALEYGCGVVALCSPEPGMEETPDSAISIAGKLVSYLTSKGIAESDIYIDPMLKPVGAAPDAGKQALKTIEKLHSEFPNCHISCGLSNLSYGLPKRRVLNRAFAVCAIAAGLDTAIADPLDKGLMSLIAAAEVIVGRDEYCMEYIEKCRSGLIEA